MNNKKILHFFFPLPTIIMTVFTFIMFGSVTFEEKSGNLFDVAGMTFIFYIMVMIPVDIVIWIIKKLIKNIKLKQVSDTDIHKLSNNSSSPDHQCNKTYNTTIQTDYSYTENEQKTTIKDDYYKGAEKEASCTETLKEDKLDKSGNIEFDIMSGEEFELFCANLLRDMSYTDVQLTKASGDHGVDITCNYNGVSYAIQCKCYSSNIGNSAIQQVHAGKSIYKKDIALVITNRFFTEQAKKEAALLGVKLWNRDVLINTLSVVNQKKSKEEAEKKELEKQLRNQLKEKIDEIAMTIKNAIEYLGTLNIEYVNGKLIKNGYEFCYDAKTTEQAIYILSLNDDINDTLAEDGSKITITRLFDNRLIVRVYES